MGIPLTIFTLFRLDGDGGGCRHFLLLRVPQPAFSNADEGSYEHAVRAADARRDVLMRSYEREILPGECGARHAAHLVGELQAPPVGEALNEGPGGMTVDLWIAQTGYGAPWVVLGSAPDEETFWREVDADEDLAGLEPLRPAVLQRAFFLAADAEA